MHGFRIFVIGAGFSRPAGLPLGNELWSEIRTRVSQISSRRHFEDDLEEYIRFKQECYGEEVSVDDVDFEDFLGFLDLEHFLGLRGSDTFSEEGNESQVIIKTLIGQILVERTPAGNALPQLYYDFAEALEPTDYVLTFNYDVILERALEARGKPFRLFPNRYEAVYRGQADIDSSREETVILKLHGSVDWFDRGSYAYLEEFHKEQGFPGGPRHPVFGPESAVTAVPLVEGPRFPDDPLLSMYRVPEVDSLYQSSILFHATPWLLSPSKAKVVYAEKLKDFWRGLGQAGGWNLGLVIIGYSLPQHDDYARQMLYRLVKNFQEFSWDEELVGGQRKRPVLLIDKPDPEQALIYGKRYGFVDPEKAVYHMTGFNEEAVRLIREGP